MANSFNLTTASPGQNTVAVPFDKINRLHVRLEINGVPITNFVWNSDSVLGLATPLTGGESVYVFRVTPDETPVVTYAPGNITAKNLNDQNEQLLFISQEAKDNSQASIGLDFSTNQFDAQGKRLEDLADPVNPTDAVTKRYADGVIGVAQTIVSNADTSITNKISAAETQFNADKAQTSADRVATGQDRVATGQDRVATGQDRVQTGSDKTAASGSATLAQKWASEPEDSVVSGGLFSAFHWAMKAAALVAGAFVAAINGFATKATPSAGDQFGYRQASDGVGRQMTFANLQSAISRVAVVRRQVFTASGTYTPHAKMLYCQVEVVGGGGGGGAFDSSVTTGQGCTGGGGGSGGYSRSILSKADVGASVTVSIGGGGIGTTTYGNPGGTTSFGGSLCQANGGSGGINYGSGGKPGPGATAGTGNVLAIRGQAGEAGLYAITCSGISGTRGGSSPFGGSADQPPFAQAAGHAGTPGYGYGGGGGGACGQATSSFPWAGGAGSAGICIVTEFCSE